MSIDKYVYKYRKISTVQDIEFLYDILKNNRLYFPRYSELNDPLEGTVFGIYPSDGYAGISILLAAGEELPMVTSIKDQYRILSFSSTPFSLQMWAHYAGNYTGVCLCYRVLNEFESLVPVQYLSRQKIINCDIDDIEEIVYNNLFYKQMKWKYEEEYRIVKKTEDIYYKYDYNLLKAVIIGEKLSDELKDIIRCIIPNDVQIFQTRIEAGRFKIVLEPLDYEIDYDGSVPFGIRTKKALESKIENLKYPHISWGFGTRM